MINPSGIDQRHPDEWILPVQPLHPVHLIMRPWLDHRFVRVRIQLGCPWLSDQVKVEPVESVEPIETF